MTLPEEADADWLARTRGLILRRHAALLRSIVEDGWFDPLILELDEDAGADAGAGSTPEAADPALVGLSPVSQALMPWVAGFEHATACFPDLTEIDDDAVRMALARLFRHLPAETPEDRSLADLLDREHPLASLDDAMEELVATVADLHDLTETQRFHVETVRRETPKVGRNDPCPCGSGRKYKVCHGRD